MSAERTKIAEEAQFDDDGDRVLVEVEGVEIAVFRLEDDYHAVVNYCPHQSGPLCEGELRSSLRGADDGWRFEPGDDDVVICPWHGWRFDVRTGESAESDRYSVPTYEIEVDDGDVFLQR